MTFRSLLILPATATLLVLHSVVAYAEAPTPDIPEVNGFVPTQMAEIEGPHPFANRVIVAEPVANTYGTAEITYPIDIPAGRNGLQPNIDLMYSSSNGASVFGYGWTMQQPAITIDTRWGVPRYDSRYETEIYMLNGTQIVQKDGNPELTLPYQTHTQQQRRNGNVSFMSRDTKNKDVITRHGNSPRNYWWSVVDRNGTTYYYGKYASESTINHACVLQDSTGNIGYWALCEVVDLFGNYIKYQYERDTSCTDIYLKYIYYTGHRSNGVIDIEPAYYISFQYYNHLYGSPIDGRLGFIRETTKNLYYIIIKETNNSGFERHYVFEYNITNRIWYLCYITHTQGVYNEYGHPVYSGEQSSHVSEATQFTYDTPSLSTIFNIPEDTIHDLQAQDKNFLNHSTNRSWGLGGTLTVGFGTDSWTTNLSVGGNYNYSESIGKTLYQLFDIDGDALADKVYTKHDSIYYRKHIIDGNGKHWFTTERNTGIHSPNLSKEISKTNHFGLQAGADPIVSVSGGWSNTDTYTSSFFADVNADGLPDFVDDGVVHFNRINTYGDFLQHNGSQVEIPIEQDACNSYFYYDGAVELDKKCHVDTMLLDSFTVSMPTIPTDDYECGDCEYMCREYLYEENDSFESQCLECSQHCDIDLTCSPCDVDCYGNLDCEFLKMQCMEDEGCTNICSRCLLYYLYYGENSTEYLNCKDTACLFKGQEMICEDCRDICEISPALCNQCIYENCLADLEYDGCLVNNNEICDECCEYCNGDFTPEECNQCKEENNCKGVIDEDAFGLCEEASNFQDSLNCIMQLFNENAICEECQVTCRTNPSQCIPCLNRHCYYQNPEYVYNNLVLAGKNRIWQSYPNAKFFQRGDTYYAYQSETICTEEETISITPDIEAVRVWVAPYDGTVNLTSKIQLLQDNSSSRKQSRTADGVHCVIQHNKGIDTISVTNRLIPTNIHLIDVIKIPAADYNIHNSTYSNISVSKGDIFFFHLASRASHSFDDVNWEQTFEYTNCSGTYSSVNDYTCSSSDVYCPDTTSGTIRIELNASSTSNVPAVLMVNKTTVDSNDNRMTTPVDMRMITSSSLPLNDIIIANWQPRTSFSIILSGTENLGQIEVKPRIAHIRPSKSGVGNDTIISYIAPQLQFAPEVNLGSTYYDLFGPLYKGWGQFAINNTTGSDVVILDSLYCNSKQKASDMNVQGQSIFEANLQSFDTLQLSNPSYLESSFQSMGLFNPTDTNSLWIEMKADAKEYRWEAYGRVARNGRRLLSNTRDGQAASTYFSTSSTSVNWESYDNAVPVATNANQRITAIRKKSNSKQWDAAWGVGLGFVGVGSSYSEGTYKVCTDYMDMNGDRFPDIIQESSIQYTQPWGGLGKIHETDSSKYCEMHQISTGHSFSGTSPKIFSIPGNNPKNNRFASSVSGTVSLSAAQTVTESETIYALTDLNGDGLPDKISCAEDSVIIYLNTGYEFRLMTKIPNLDNLGKSISTCSNQNISFGSGFEWERLAEEGASFPNSQISEMQVSLSVGTSASESANETRRLLVDIDGDGWTDLLTISGQSLIMQPAVYYSNNNTENVHMPSEYLQHSETMNAGLDLAVTGGCTIMYVKLCAGIHGTPLSLSETKGNYDLTDVNGDGLPDLVRSDQNGIYVRYNQMGKRGLLKSIKNVYRNHIDLDYTLSQPTSGQPYRQMLLTSIKNIDDSATIETGIPVTEKRISYADPHYDSSERQSYGYGCVTTYDMYPATNDDSARVYRKRIQRYQNQEYAEHGKLVYDAIADSADNIYTEYELGTIYYDASGNETDNTCQDTKIRVGKEAHLTRYYEGTAEPITTAKLYDYDNYYNVTQYEDLGDSLITDDDLLATITYENRAQYINRNLISLPTDVLVKVAGQNIRKSRSEYTAEGKLSKQVLSSLINGSDSCVTDYLYNDLGLLSHVTLPPNQNNQRGTISITYDSFMYILPQKITNHFGYTQRYTYSSHWQKPLQVVSPAGDTISYEYDSFGRLTTITAPFERNTGRHSVKYTYGTIDYYNNNIYVDAKTYTEGDSTLQRSLYDSSGLLLQRQKRRGSNYIVTDRHSYDYFGRLIKTYSPTTANNLSNSYISQNRQLVASYTYDILDRQTSVHWNDANHNVSIMQYTLGDDHQGIRRFKTLLTDENSHQWQTYTSPQGWVTTTVAPDNATTRFVHDALGQLISSTDPDSMTTTHTYDGLGRHIQRNHPDAGIDRWQYDPAGNIIAKQAQCQYVFSQHTTNYHYMYDRLDSICYSFHPEMNVVYTYDSVSGRLLQRSDLTGKERFKYDALGNVTESRRQIVMPNETYAYTFLTRYKYDSFGKMREITYPDGEVVSYTYRDGLLKGMQGTHFNRTINYITDITYTNDDKLQVINYGNGVVNTFDYDNVHKWMTSSYLLVPEASDYEHRTYSYDGVGNITGIAQDVPVRVSVLGGVYTTNYTYDQQNRLITASQQSSSLGSYNYAMTYSPAGCVGQKQCAAANADLKYAYRKDNNNCRINHQIAGICVGPIHNIITRINWDGEGRLNSMYGSCFEGLRQNKWNEAGQLAASYTDDEGAYFGYDGNGERVYKLRCNVSVEQLNAGMQHVMLWFTNSTLYVNPYLVVTPQGYTKYYYSGTNRVAAQHGSISHLQAQFNHSDTVAALISKANTFMESMIGNMDIYLSLSETLISISGSPVWGDLSPRCQSLLRSISTTSLQNQLLPVISGDVQAMECDPLQPARYFYHADHLGIEI